MCSQCSRCECPAPSRPHPETVGPHGTVSGMGTGGDIEDSSRVSTSRWGPGEVCYRTHVTRRCSSSTEASQPWGQPPKCGGAMQILHRGLSRRHSPTLTLLMLFLSRGDSSGYFSQQKLAVPPPDKTKRHQSCRELSARCPPRVPGPAAACRASKPKAKRSNTTPKQSRKPGGSWRTNPARTAPPPLVH